MAQGVNKDLHKIIYLELGEKSAELFDQFYDQASFPEQVRGAEELLSMVVGEDKTKELLKKFKGVV